MQAVIYIFRCPKGRVYAGRRTVSPEALRCWPSRGTGALPDGYAGSGKAWQAVARKHRDTLIWRILARVDGTSQDADMAERRAVALVRALFGRRCLNLRDGGQGMTSRDARALWADPAYAERTGAAIREAFARPEVRAKLNAAANTPEARQRRSATSKAVAQTPEGRGRLARATEASLTPEARAKRNTGQSEDARAKRRESLRAVAATDEGREVLTRAVAASTSPVAQARRLLTRTVNQYRLFAAAHPELFQ
ncbi:hypothetical protein DFP89_101169 [Paracoccus lutimaris]|uniref:GIY-YIG domain-containing protein n=2 Tax=Paracoccus lutimaris TaxID=1490030 RepID=A0A368Z8J8_9RHOB|nr:hypothetical protein DFP89_101169 [Paracoccus lutimaris]